jgi:uncharacterized protein with GYD domain
MFAGCATSAGWFRSLVPRMGKFIIEAPNDQKVGEMVLAIAARGYVRTRTHRLFSEDEVQVDHIRIAVTSVGAAIRL